MIVFLLTRVTSGQNYQQSSYCKTHPTSSGIQLECSMTKTPSRAHWFLASRFFLLHMARRSLRVFSSSCDHVQLTVTMKDFRGNHSSFFFFFTITIMWLRFKSTLGLAERHRKTEIIQCEFTTKYAATTTTKKKKKQEQKLTCWRGQAQRTACSWGQMKHSVQTDQMLEEVALFFSFFF